jgi:hypothetical protein
MLITHPTEFSMVVYRSRLSGNFFPDSGHDYLSVLFSGGYENIHVCVYSFLV